MKPSFEPIVVARKPLASTVAGNVLAHGTGALNVDGCRVGRDEGDRTDYGLENGAAAGIGYHGLDGRTPYDGSAGRWPANVVLDPEAAAVLDEQTGERRSAGEYVKGNGTQGAKAGAASIPIDGLTSATYADTGGASRFFYVAKADSAERNAGLAITTLFTPPDAPTRNDHPTVKPIALMRWLVRLVTPPGGLVVDPFAGSGTTGCAAVLEGFDFLGVERDVASVNIARARLAHWSNGGSNDG